MLYNPYDLIIIKENVIPQEHIEEIMLLANNTKDISQATIINDKKEDLAELSQTSQPDVETSEDDEEQTDVSLEEVSESENQASDTNTDDTEASNS